VVLKIYDAGTRRFAVKEARALSFLTGHGLDISPRVLAFSRSAGPLGGRPCLVSSLRPGRTLADLDAELTGAQRREVYRQLGAVLKRLHAIPAGGYGDVNGQIRDPLPCTPRTWPTALRYRRAPRTPRPTCPHATLRRGPRW
jgi:hygromycin-B 7''-O-kinase